MKKRAKKSKKQKNPSSSSQEIRHLYSQSNELANGLFGVIDRTKDPKIKHDLEKAFICIEKAEKILLNQII